VEVPVRYPSVNGYDHHGGQSKRADQAKYRLVSVRQIHRFFLTAISRPSRLASVFKRAALRAPRRPMIAPVLLPSAAPIAPFDFRAAFNSRRRSSSSRLPCCYFFGIAVATRVRIGQGQPGCCLKIIGQFEQDTTRQRISHACLLAAMLRFPEEFICIRHDRGRRRYRVVDLNPSPPLPFGG
jgi:hypothetical protein